MRWVNRSVLDAAAEARGKAEGRRSSLVRVLQVRLGKAAEVAGPPRGWCLACGRRSLSEAHGA